MSNYPKDTYTYLIPDMVDGKVIWYRKTLPWDSALCFVDNNLGITLSGKKIKLVDWYFKLEDGDTIKERQKAFLIDMFFKNE
jgi:hypothetical protein